MVLSAKGLDYGPDARQLRYTSDEGRGAQDPRTLSRAQRRRLERQSRRNSAAADQDRDHEGKPRRPQDRRKKA